MKRLKQPINLLNTYLKFFHQSSTVLRILVWVVHSSSEGGPHAPRLPPARVLAQLARRRRQHIAGIERSPYTGLVGVSPFAAEYLSCSGSCSVVYIGRI
jgi:hypothetical protein